VYNLAQGQLAKIVLFGSSAKFLVKRIHVPARRLSWRDVRTHVGRTFLKLQLLAVKLADFSGDQIGVPQQICNGVKSKEQL